MGGYFGVASKETCIFDLFFGTDYHSHLGTKRGGLAVYGENGFVRAIHNIENSPFRTKFSDDIGDMRGNMGIGCISDTEPQPLLIRSHLGNYAITTVGCINNLDEIIKTEFTDKHIHFLEHSGGTLNPTEVISALIDQKDSFVEGIRYAQSVIKGSVSMLILTATGIYAARDKLGRTPIVIGKKDEGFCLSFESFAYLNLGYRDYKELGPAEIVFVTPDEVKTVAEPQKEMKICTFLWVYFGYPASCYEGMNVEKMRYNCGAAMAKRDNAELDIVAGVPDSGIAHAVGYANESGIEYSRPFVKYTPTWPRSFMPPIQEKRNLIAKMKLIPIKELIHDKKMLLIDDSIVRGTQLSETTQFLYEVGAKEVHVRPACPPIMFGCKYLNFSRSTSDMDLIARRVIAAREKTVTEEILEEYTNPESKRYEMMLEDIRKQLNFTTLRYNRIDDMLAATGIEPCKLCTYCWTGKE